MAEVDRIEYQHTAARLDAREQIEAERAAIHQFDTGRKAERFMQRFDSAHAKAFVGPQQVADTKYQYVASPVHRFV